MKYGQIQNMTTVVRPAQKPVKEKSRREHVQFRITSEMEKKGEMQNVRKNVAVAVGDLSPGQ